MMTLPIHDNHLHLSPSGRNIDALREYKAAGGTGLTLVTLPYPEVRITCGDDFRKSFQITVDFAEKARELGLKVYTAVGPYPILLISLAEQYGMEKAEQIMTDGMRIAAEFINEGKADLMGEVGRPHFDTDQKYVDACNRVLQYGMDLAHEGDFAVMIHCES
ncbi:MAG: TatD family hydrolase, partial [Candidatus Methanomethylophilaceae archaeon]|nr:TatD family hydrolase [Candidatus Methanomethylophilaceae archaeon]